jgi:hypothetical protein
MVLNSFCIAEKTESIFCAPQPGIILLGWDIQCLYWQEPHGEKQVMNAANCYASYSGIAAAAWARVQVAASRRAFNASWAIHEGMAFPEKPICLLRNILKSNIVQRDQIFRQYWCCPLACLGPVNSSIGLTGRDEIKFRNFFAYQIRRIHSLMRPFQKLCSLDVSCWPFLAALQRRSFLPDFPSLVPLFFSDLLVLNVFSVQTRLAHELSCLNGLTDCWSAVDACDVC